MNRKVISYLGFAKKSGNHIEYGNSEELSHAVGASGRNVFAICDKGFAEAITKEIERELE